MRDYYLVVRISETSIMSSCSVVARLRSGVRPCRRALSWLYSFYSFFSPAVCVGRGAGYERSGPGHLCALRLLVE